MIVCSRCGFGAPDGSASCPRCGTALGNTGPPPPPSRPTMTLTLEAPDLPSKDWEISDEPVGIGRLDDSDIPVPHKSVSRQHARIVPTGSGFEIEDLGSTNGTWLNDRAITDRTPLSNGDQLVIGDVPLRVHLRQPVVVVPQTPQPLPAPTPMGNAGGGPSTVYYDIDDALAAAQPSTSTAWDVTPATAAPPPPLPAVPQVEEQATLTGMDVAAEPTPNFEPRPTPLPPPPPTPTFEPRPTPPPPTPTFEPSPSRAHVTATPAASASDGSAASLIELADRLANGLRLFKGDAALALWLFEQAGGAAAAQAFSTQAQSIRTAEDQARLLEMAPTAARLLEAAVLLANVVSSLSPPDDESKSNAANLQPVARP